MQIESVQPVEALANIGNKPPKVSVCVVTYNQANYISQCLQSIVDQETDFQFEVIVGDDCSKDRTVEIISEFANKYPALIKPIFRKKNIGPSGNYFDVVSRCAGQYISHIDGDDVMLPGKLSSQASILDKYRDIAVVAHAMVGINENALNIEIEESKGGLQIYKQSDLLKLGCFFIHSSKMYRRSAIMTRQTDRLTVDYYLHLEHSHSGDIAYIEKQLGAYRIHCEGISKNIKWRNQIIEAYDNAFNRAIELGVELKLVNYGRVRHRQAIALSALRCKDYKTFCEFIDIPSEYKYGTSIRQNILSATSRVPKLAGLLQSIKMTFSG